jgi:hypothetical protein
MRVENCNSDNSPCTGFLEGPNFSEPPVKEPGTDYTVLDQAEGFGVDVSDLKAEAEV